MKRILILGKNGQIGTELQHSLSPLGSIIAADKETCDLASPEQITSYVRSVKPDLIVNAAAYTAVDQAEENASLAASVNAIAPGILGEEAKKLKIPLIHYSTDYVFDGSSSTPYTESDLPNPLNVYGKTKWAGEQAILASGCDCLILRTSWVYGWHGRNFLLTMLKLGAEKNELRIVDDQIGIPNWSRQLADTTAQIINTLEPGMADIFHLSCCEPTSWFGFASAIFELSTLTRKPRLIPIATSEYPLPACRPAYSALNSNKLAKAFNVRLPSWKETLARAIQNQ